MRRKRTIYFNDARHYYLFVFEPPMTMEDAWGPVDEVAGTAVDTFIYGVEREDGIFYPSKATTQFGEDRRPFKDAYEWRTWENMKSLEARGLDPLTVLIDRAHEKGIQIICSMRMNGGNTATHFRGSYTAGKLQRYNPEALLGEEDPENPSVAGCAPPSALRSPDNLP